MAALLLSFQPARSQLGVVVDLEAVDLEVALHLEVEVAVPWGMVTEAMEVSKAEGVAVLLLRHLTVSITKVAEFNMTAPS